jgi:alpha-glucosidase (family GH31 glycosyl hydrolase)
MSIMRVHSTLNDLPHFPFLYPQDKADAMRSALQLRYQLLPHMYSLAHVQYTLGLPVARPLFMQFPDDLSVVNTVPSAAVDTLLSKLKTPSG